MITFTEPNSLEEYDEGVLVHRVKPALKWYKARFSPQVRNLIRHLRPDIVHIQSPAPLTQEHAIVNGYRYLATYHNDPVLTDRPAYRMSVRLYRKFIFPMFYKKVNRIICPSRSFQKASEFLRLVPEEKKGVIPNGVDTSLFRRPPKPKVHYRRKLGLNADHVGIFVGSMERWHAYKGVGVLLEALSELVNIEFQFILVGDGELRPMYERKARALTDIDQVKFLGKVERDTLVESYWAADFFVLPSTSVECSPIVLIEAMACGLPVITTNLPGPSDLVKDGFNGFKVRPRDPRDLANIMRRLMFFDNDELERMSVYSRKLAVEKYDWDKVVEAYLKQYSLLLTD